MLDAQQIRVRDLQDDLIPKLKSAKATVETTLHQRMIQALHDQDRERFRILRTEFQLEITMIEMNLRHLVQREAAVMERAMNGDEEAAETYLWLEDGEANAIERAQAMYRRLQGLTT